jgi:hypothetical protein
VVTASETAAQISVELERKLLERLVSEWESINYAYFNRALRRPILRLSDTRTRLGQWHGQLRSLEISRPLVLERSWAEVIEVLKHEVAHQYVDECMSVDETAHGPTFRRLCEQLGIDGRAVGAPSVTPEAEAEDDPASHMVARIHKLLALAQSSNRHEAEAAATTARRLMLKFNIEADRSSASAGDVARYGYRHLGRPSGRILDHDRRLALILTKYFFVEGIWIPVYRPLEGKRGSVFEICGLEPNLLMAEHVHAFLTTTAERLWLEYRKGSKRRSNRDRQAYLSGVMRGFDEKLAAQSVQFQEQGLVWVPAAGLDDYFRRRYPKVQTVRRGAGRRNEAFADGSRAGRQIVLSQPVERGSTGARPKALRG